MRSSPSYLPIVIALAPALFGCGDAESAEHEAPDEQSSVTASMLPCPAGTPSPKKRRRDDSDDKKMPPRELATNPAPLKETKPPRQRSVDELADTQPMDTVMSQETDHTAQPAHFNFFEELPSDVLWKLAHFFESPELLLGLRRQGTNGFKRAASLIKKGPPLQVLDLSSISDLKNTPLTDLFAKGSIYCQVPVLVDLSFRWDSFSAVKDVVEAYRQCALPEPPPPRSRPGITEINLSSGPVFGGIDPKVVLGLTRHPLRALNLSRVGLTDQGLSALTSLTVEYLDVTGNSWLSAEALTRELPKFVKLSEVRISRRIPEQARSTIRANLPATVNIVFE